MERKHKITISKPCLEDWNKMTPNDNGRFCGNCSKNVVDFTNMLPDEIQIYFQQHSNICGRFKNSQLNSLTIQIPNQVFYSQTHYHKMFLLALFIAMGTTLFSCSDKNGSKQKIDKIEVVNEHKPETDRIMVGDAKYNPNDTLHNIPPPPPPPKIDQIKFVEQPNHKKNKHCKLNKDSLIHMTSMGEIVIDTTKTNNKEISNKTKDKEIDKETLTIWETIYKNPEYPGGENEFKNHIKKNYIFPKNTQSLNGKIQASFVIERDGSISNIKTIKDIENGTGDELIRILKTSKNWRPGFQNGKPTRNKCYITLFVKTNILKKSLFRTEYISKIDSISIKDKQTD
jgi:hypothetical protein